MNFSVDQVGVGASRDDIPILLLYTLAHETADAMLGRPSRMAKKA